MFLQKLFFFTKCFFLFSAQKFFKQISTKLNTPYAIKKFAFLFHLNRAVVIHTFFSKKMLKKELDNISRYHRLSIDRSNYKKKFFDQVFTKNYIHDLLEKRNE
jgi:hypothetical protein